MRGDCCANCNVVTKLLRLNRAQLIELRLQRARAQRLRETLEHNQRANVRLREYVRELEQETERLLETIAELTGE